MTARKASGTSFLDLLRERGGLPADARLRVALDVLEPIAAGATATRLVPRRAGSRFDVNNVRIAIRGRARLHGAGNRSGLQVLLWEILAGRSAPEGRIPPLHAVVDDVEPEVADAIDSAVAASSSMPDARALLKGLVVASAGAVGRRKDTAKLVASTTTTPAVDVAETPVERHRQGGFAPPTPPGDSAPITDPGDALDAVVGEELSRIAPDGWDDWDLGAGPPAGAAEIADATDGESADDLVQEIMLPPPGPGVKRAPPPLSPRDPALARPDVVLIEPDELTAAHLAGVLRRAGYLIEICADADAAVGRVCATQPKCVVCDDELVPGGGGDVALRARTNSPRACLAPFIFLTPRHRDAGAPRTRAGARDVWLEKPFSNDALIAHVKSFAGSLAVHAHASSMLPPSGEIALNGELAHISLPTVLSMLKLERRSGSLQLTSGDRQARIAFVSGEPTKAKLGGRPMRPEDALAIAATWQDGRFAFKTLPIPNRASALA